MTIPAPGDVFTHRRRPWQTAAIVSATEDEVEYDLRSGARLTSGLMSFLARFELLRTEK